MAPNHFGRISFHLLHDNLWHYPCEYDYSCVLFKQINWLIKKIMWLKLHIDNFFNLYMMDWRKKTLVWRLGANFQIFFLWILDFEVLSKTSFLIPKIENVWRGGLFVYHYLLRLLGNYIQLYISKIRKFMSVLCS